MYPRALARIKYTQCIGNRCSNYESRRESARPENCSLFSPDHREWGGIRCRPVFERFDMSPSTVPDESLNSSSLSQHRKHPEYDQGFPALLPILSCRSSCSWHTVHFARQAMNLYRDIGKPFLFHSFENCRITIASVGGVSNVSLRIPQGWLIMSRSHLGLANQATVPNSIRCGHTYIYTS